MPSDRSELLAEIYRLQEMDRIRKHISQEAEQALRDLKCRCQTLAKKLREDFRRFSEEPPDSEAATRLKAQVLELVGYLDIP